MSASPTPAIALVRRSGVANTIRSYDPPIRHGRERDERPDYGLEAAAALGIVPERVCKTLVTVADEDLVAAVLPVDRRLDLKALAAAVGARRAEIALPTVAERASGSVVGGISPLAPRRPWSVVVDAAALVHPTVMISAGRRGLQIELAPADLVRLTSAIVAAIGRIG